MKKIYTVICSLLISAASFSQVPDSLWSAVNLNPTNGSIANGIELSNGNILVAISDNKIAEYSKTGSIISDTSLSTEFNKINQIWTNSLGDYWILGQSPPPSRGVIYQNVQGNVSVKKLEGYGATWDLVQVNSSFYVLADHFSTNHPHMLKLNAQLDSIMFTDIYINSFNRATDIKYVGNDELLIAGFWDDYPAIWNYDTSGTQNWIYDSTQFISLSSAQAYKTNIGYTYIGRNLLINLDMNGKFVSEQYYGNHDFFGILWQNQATLLYGTTRITDTNLNNTFTPMVASTDTNYKIIDSVLYELRASTDQYSSFRGGVLLSTDEVFLNGIHADNASDKNNIMLYLSGNYVNSVEEIQDVQQLSVYPNPFNDQFTIKSDKKIDQIRIWDQSGRLLRTERIAGLNTAIISSESLTTGLYILEVFTEDGEILRHRMLRE